MSKFYFYLWLRWAIRLTACSLVLASIFSILILLYIFITQSVSSLDMEVLKALFDVFKFWFSVSWNLAFLIALFRSLKFIFNRCNAGYMLKLLSCKDGDFIEVIGYGDLVKVWRRWFMLLIWLVGAIMIFALAITHFFTSFTGVFEWFNIYYLYTFILVAGYFSFIIMASTCKQTKVVKC